MTRRSTIWLVAVVSTFINFGGGVIAAAQGEPLHAGIHAGLLLLSGYFAWRLAPASYARRIWRPARSAVAGIPRELIDSLTHLEQSVDAVAIEVERIGEGQRFMTGLFAESGALRARGEGAAEPIDINAGEAAPPT
jgi:hypothetical protein